MRKYTKFIYKAGVAIAVAIAIAVTVCGVGFVIGIALARPAAAFLGMQNNDWAVAIAFCVIYAAIALSGLEYILRTSKLQSLSRWVRDHDVQWAKFDNVK